MKLITHIFIHLCIIFYCISCNTPPDKEWVRIQNKELYIWATPNPDIKYEWDGESFDKLINGFGILYTYNRHKLIDKSKITAHYGTIDSNDIITLSDGSCYIGKIQDDLFDGFGVYLNGPNIYIGTFSGSKPNGLLNWYKNQILYYSGEWKDGNFQGEGVLYKEDGSIKKGRWENGKLIRTYCSTQTDIGFYDGYTSNGKPDGIGSMTYNNHTSYKGNWSEGRWSGYGEYSTPTDTLTGEWKDGKLNGLGIYKSKDFFYKGEWLDNKPDGIGYANAGDSSFYDGEWENGKKAGYGDMLFSNGDSYWGEWENNQFNGVGTYNYAQNGDSYYGEWENGLQNGLGTYKAQNFEYTGNWEAGWINGEGRITYDNNDFYEGNFVENERYGLGYYQFSNRNSYEGEFIDGKFNGLGIFRFADGNVYEGEFQDGKIKGDGTLYYIEGVDTLAITACWDGSLRFPRQASILFGNGDLYEGELIDGVPTENGVWSTIEDRERGAINSNNNLHKANEFYKKHKDTWNKAIKYTSTALSIVELIAPVGSVLVVTGVAAPIGTALITAGKIAGVINTAINISDATIASTSAGIDIQKAITNGDDYTEALSSLKTELAVNAAFIVAPKALKNLPIRKAQVALSASAKNIKNAASTSLIILNKNMVFAKMFKVTKDKYGILQKNLNNSSIVQRAKNIASAAQKKFESLYLATLLPRTLINKELQRIRAKGPIKLTRKDWTYLKQNPDKPNLKAIIEKYTGDKNAYLEFFIRWADGNKKQVAEILDQPKIREYIDKAIRKASGESGYHEWLMTKNFKSFLLDEKWGNDGAFLAIAQSKLIQRTRNLTFKGGGGHVAGGRPNSPESVAFHKGLAEVIDQCNSKEELFVNIRAYAKSALTDVAYKEFNTIFKDVLQTTVDQP